MKKHLIAAAVAATLAAPVMAQNVTLSGYVEAGYQSLSHSGDTATAAAQDNSGIVGGIFGSSRLIIGGSEDLGGGLKAGFRLETSLDVSSGRAGASTLGGQAGSGNGEFFNRGAEINLSGAFGMVRIGQFDHQGGENTDVNAVGNIALATGMTSQTTATGVEIGTDRKGTIAYRSPTINGFYVEAAHSTADGQKTSATTQSTAGSVSSIFAQYAAGPVEIRAGHATEKSMGTVTATNDDASRTGFGVKVDFGVASGSVHYAKATLINQTKNDEVVASLNIPLGNGLDARGVYRNFDTNNAAASTTATSDMKEYTVALVKALSKRTSISAAFTTQNRTSTNAVGATDSDRYFVGVGHTF